MPIWSAEIKELEKLYESFKGQIPELEKELGRLIKADDENMILLYSRRCLEVIITDLCECELKRPRKTEPLKGIIDKLNKEGKVPSNIITSMDHLNSLSVYGAHPKDFDPEQVKPVLVNLDIIIKWYLKYKETKTIHKAETEEVKDEGLVSDDTAEKIEKSKKRLILLLSGLTLVVAIVVVALFVLNIIGGGNQIKDLEKSIAVLPFKNDSPDQERMYFINGTMEAILDNLCKIEDLRVVSRNSVEKYRDNPKPTPVVAKEMNVSYVLEGSGHRDGNNVRLYVQLLDTTIDKHLWSKTYDADIEEIFSMQSEIAHLVATEIEAIITPEEQQLIDKVPTTNLTALDFYQRGREELNNGNVNRAEDLFREALSNDSSFAEAYLGMANVLFEKRNRSEYYSENFLDSMLIMVNKALAFDDQLSEAYSVRGMYYLWIGGEKDLGLADIEKAINLNPNNGEAYYEKASFYSWIDFVKSLDNYHTAISINRGPDLNNYLKDLAWEYFQAGFVDKSTQYYNEALRLDDDSAHYFNRLGQNNMFQGNYNTATDLLQRSVALGYKNANGPLGFSLLREGKYKEALKAYENWIEYLKESNILSFNNSQRIAYAYYVNGNKKEAEDYFDLQIEYSLGDINLNRMLIYKIFGYYDLAGIYAFRGEKDKAYENLRLFNQIKVVPYWMLQLIKSDELFENIREEPEFQQIVRDVEAKYQAEHERVRKWLEEHGML